MSELGELRKVFRGYAPDAVEALVRDATSARDRLRAELQQLRERARTLGTELEEVQQPERELRDTFVTAQREAEELRAQAAREADAIRGAARTRADERRGWLDSESARVRSEVERMRGVEREFRTGIRLILLEAMGRLDASAGTQVAEPQAESPFTTAPPPPAAAAIPPEAPAIVSPPAPPLAPAGPSLEDDTIDMPAVPGESPPVADRHVEARPLVARPIVYSIAILVAAAGIAVAIWQLRTEAPAPTHAVTEVVTTSVTVETVAGSAEPAAQTAEAPPDTAEAVESAATTRAGEAAQTGAEPPGAAPTTVALVLRAAGGDCWLSVRASSAGGRLLFEGFLFRGESRRFEAKRVWVRVGNGGNLAARLNGRPLEGLPAGTGDVLVTAEGARTLSLG